MFSIKTLYKNEELREKFHANLINKSKMISQDKSESLLMILYSKLMKKKNKKK